MIAITQGERIAALETQVSFLVEEQRETNRKLEASNNKLDELIALRNKGAGIFWLATIIFGTSLAGALSILVSYLKGH